MEKKKVKFAIDMTISYADEKSLREAIAAVKKELNLSYASSSGFVITSGKVSAMFDTKPKLP